jgi:cephalosporin-C deacetylase-like acetyl esterase
MSMHAMGKMWGQAVGGTAAAAAAAMARSSAVEMDPSAPRVVPPDLSDMRRFLTSPIPKECGVIQCYIRRNKSGVNKLFPMYSLYMKDGDEDRFLMCSKKRPNNKTSNYLISKCKS